jgi:hypothetical protein
MTAGKKFLRVFNGVLISTNIYLIIYFVVNFYSYQLNLDILDLVDKILSVGNIPVFLTLITLVLIHIQPILMLSIFIFRFKNLREYVGYYVGAFFSLLLFAALFVVAVSSYSLID